MTDSFVIDTTSLGRKRGVRGRPKGRQVDPQALTEIRALLGDSPRRHDLLIEFLHRIQDTYGHISPAHVVALAEELALARTEVYEVATFYHHFDVLGDDETPPPEITVRVCETLSCQMAGAEALMDALSATRRRMCACLPRRVSVVASTRPPRSSASARSTRRRRRKSPTRSRTSA